MAGNELEITRFLVSNLGKISLNHLGVICEVDAPIKNGGYNSITSLKQIEEIAHLKTQEKKQIYT